jgi:hypothetical protein
LNGQLWAKADALRNNAQSWKDVSISLDVED